jgi:regulator of ribonuclease activity A
MKTDKKGIGEQNVVVSFAGVTFTPGDYIYADNNGIITSKKSLA